MKQKSIIVALIPVMLAFFVMGFVDLVGTATNYIKADFNLLDKDANFLPSMVFFWFLFFSVPAGMLMNRIGRKKTVVISLVVTAASLLLPYLSYSYGTVLIAFSLLGIGNALMQVSLNPLLSNIVSGEKLASTMTFGQFIKAIASMSAPLLAPWAAIQLGDWRLIFPIYMVIAIIATLWLATTKIEEADQREGSSTFFQCLSLLGNKTILLSFLGIMCHVGVDVGLNVTAPKILMERVGLTLDAASFGTFIYFVFRTLGCLSGTFILARFSDKRFFLISTAMMLAGIVGLAFVQSLIGIYICIALVGYGNSNVFPIIFSQALLSMPTKKNEVSGLMIMGLFGGTIFPFLMGVLSDAFASQTGAIIVFGATALYLFFFSFLLKKKAA